MNQETKRTKLSVHDLVQLSVLIAIMLLLELTGLGMIKTAGLEITIMLVPVIVGAIVMGPAAGALLGGVFGLISFWECFGKSAFGVVLMGINPFLTFLVCVPTRILAGWICGLVFQALRKVDKTRLLSFGAAGLSGALCNTAFFMTTLCLCFYNTDFIQGFVQAMGSANAFLFVIAFVGVNGLVEAIVCFFTGAVIAKAVVFSSGKLAARRTGASAICAAWPPTGSPPARNTPSPSAACWSSVISRLTPLTVPSFPLWSPRSPAPCRKP